MIKSKNITNPMIKPIFSSLLIEEGNSSAAGIWDVLPNLEDWVVDGVDGTVSVGPVIAGAVKGISMVETLLRVVSWLGLFDKEFVLEIEPWTVWLGLGFELVRTSDAEPVAEDNKLDIEVWKVTGATDGCIAIGDSANVDVGSDAIGGWDTGGGPTSVMSG
jgi:hypothetical protein